MGVPCHYSYRQRNSASLQHGRRRLWTKAVAAVPDGPNTQGAKYNVVMRPLGSGTASSTKVLTPVRPTTVPLVSTSPSTLRVPVIPAQVIEVDQPVSFTEFKWAQDSYSVTQRTIDTWTFFIFFRIQLALLDQKWSYLGGYTDEKKAARTRSLARYLLKSVLNLGPTFIKIGQLFSTRSDLFPLEFVQELSKLQDRVPAFSAAKARTVIETDLRKPVSSLFRTFDPQPIAAASLGQVHRATLLNGDEVVIKVQRPGLRQLFDIDLQNLKILAELLDKGSEDGSRDFKGVYQECASVLYDEIDYIHEGQNCDRFRRDFRAIAWVKVPSVYWQYCSPRVLVMKYLPGVKISAVDQLRRQGLDTQLIARLATEAYLLQILKSGFFHADPHPGNVAVDEKGHLVMYDFGMMGEIVPNVRERLLDVFYGIYRKDAQAVVQALIELKVIKVSGDQLSVRRAVGYFIENIARQTEEKQTISAIGEDLFAIALDQPFRFPATFTFVLRAFSTLEGICKTLDPEYNFATVAAPFVQELLAIQDTRTQTLLLTELRQQATQLTSNMTAMPERVQRMDQLLGSMEAGDTKLRVRVLEAERAARRASVMQSATLNLVGAMGMLNLGTMLALAENELPAGMALILGAIFAGLTWAGFRRVERLDKFERNLRS